MLWEDRGKQGYYTCPEHVLVAASKCCRRLKKRNLTITFYDKGITMSDVLNEDLVGSLFCSFQTRNESKSINNRATATTILN